MWLYKLLQCFSFKFSDPDSKNTIIPSFLFVIIYFIAILQLINTDADEKLDNIHIDFVVVDWM